MTKLKIKSNESAQTFTIRKYVNGKFFSKYRTLKCRQITQSESWICANSGSGGLISWGAS